MSRYKYNINNILKSILESSNTYITQITREPKLNFILVCQPDSHKTLYEWVNGLQTTKHITQVQVKHRKGQKSRIYTYRFINEVPLRDGDDALKVNWCELVITNENGKPTYQNAFIMDFH